MEDEARPGMGRFMNAANAITLLGACFAVGSTLLAANQRVGYALAALIGCGLCDVFDGLVARRLTRTEREAAFGQRLDSLVDACSFAMAPTLTLYAAGLRTPPELLLIALYTCCAVWRLAYFDTLGLDTTDGGRHYTGLPTTFVSLALPLACLAGFAGARWLRLAAGVTALFLSVAMVAPVRVKKPAGLWYPVLSLMAVAVATVYVVWGGAFPAP